MKEKEGWSRLIRLFTVAFVTGFSGAMMPGPLLAATIGQTMVQGFRAVIGLITGHALLELVTVALLAAGMQRALKNERVRGTIGIIGGAALVWMGWDMIHSAQNVAIELQAAAEPYSWAKLLFWGAAVCIANPYFTGWWATIGAGQLAHTAPETTSEYISFYIGHEASDYAWYSLVGLLVITGRGWLLDNIDVYQGLVYGCGIIIAVLGAWFVHTGGKFLLGLQQQAADEAEVRQRGASSEEKSGRDDETTTADDTQQ